MRSVGSNGGHAAAFTYDLARSIVYTRQGNPAWSGDERDSGVGGSQLIRSDDLFFGAKAGDVQPDWVDLNKVAIPQADEQQHLLANLIEQMNLEKKPLPRFWFLPRDLKAAVVMTGDDHANGGTVGRFQQYESDSPPGCSVADWQCVRGTSYIYPNTPISDAQVADFQSQGFEIALHALTELRELGQPGAARGLLLEPARRSGGQLSEHQCPRPPTALTASPGATGRPSRRSSWRTASAWTPTTTTGRRPGSRTDRGCSRAPGCRCASPTSTAR